MTTPINSKRASAPALVLPRQSMLAMLEARSVALVGASPRPGTFGQRMIDEVTRSPARPAVHLVNPKYRQIGERQCHPSLADLPGPVDLVLLGVPDTALEEQLALAARRGDRSAVIFGSAHDAQPNPGPDNPGPDNRSPDNPGPDNRSPDNPGPDNRSPANPDGAGPSLRARLAAIARAAGLELCGPGCMGFVNVRGGLRAVGYTEPDPLPAGPVALVTHSGSVFSAMLRTRRAIGFTVAVSSGQELVTAAPSYLEYALGLPETRVLALVLEAMRQPDQLRRVLTQAAERDIPVILLTAGRSARGRAMVAAHSGALAADDGGWEALSRAYGVHRVRDLAEMADTLELFAIGRRAIGRRAASERASGDRAASDRAAGDRAAGGQRTRGIATVHDSGLERAHAADLAEELGVPFAPISQATRASLAGILDPGLVPANPLDVWGTGAATRELFAGSLTALAQDEAVAAVALAVDLVHELDGDHSYPQAVLDAAARTDKPVAVLSNLPSVIDPELAAQLRDAGIPVLEGLRTGLLALSHLLDHATARPAPDPTAPAPDRPAPDRTGPDPTAPTSLRRHTARRRRGTSLLAAGTTSGAALLALLAEYGIMTVRALKAADAPAAAAAAEEIGYPVVLKTDEPGIQHKSDVRGVIMNLRGPGELAAAYAELSARLGRRVLICQTAPPGIELALGIARDPDLGPLIVVGAGGVLVELLADRVVALPPVDAAGAAQLLSELRISSLLDGLRGAPAADRGSVASAIAALSALAIELGDDLEALDVNPLICGPSGAIAVDALAVRRA